MASVKVYTYQTPDQIGTIVSDNGYVFHYQLHRERVYSKLFRRHVMELSGQLIWIHPITSAYRHFRSWGAIFAFCEEMSLHFAAAEVQAGAPKYPRIEPVAE